MTEYELKKVDSPDQADRCQGVAANGQCQHVAVPTSKFCPLHGGNKALESARKADARMYQLAKWQAKMGQFLNTDKIKTLNEEIALARMTLQAIIEKCDDETSLILASGRIADLVTRIEKLVTSMHRIEKASGQLLGKGSILQIAGEIVNIIDAEIEDKSKVSKIANQIAKKIAEQADYSDD